MNIFGRTSEAQPALTEVVDLLSLKSLDDHPALSDVRYKLHEAKRQLDEVNNEIDLLLATDEKRKMHRNKKRLEDLQERKLEAEKDLEGAREDYARALEPIKAEQLAAWKTKARELFDEFKPELLDAFKKHEALLRHSDLAVELGIDLRIVFAPFCSNSGESRVSNWCGFVERELG